MNLYISNLMSHITADDLKKLFLPYGHVATAKVITDKFTGVSRGFGFVTMPQEDEASKAMRELEGKNIDGRNISVAEARERTDRRFY